MYRYLAVVLVFVSTVCTADQLLNTYHISRIFAEGSSQAGFYTSEGLPQCLYEIMYIDLSNEGGKAQFSMALTAKTSNQTIKRLDYIVNTGGACHLTGMHME